MDEQLSGLASMINSEYEAAPTSDDVMLDGRPIPFSKCTFHPIPTTDTPGVLACIDGGNDTILDTPFGVAAINRLYCSVFRGRNLQQNTETPPFRFLSLMRHTATGTKFRFFPYGKGNKALLPGKAVLDGAVADLVGQGDRYRLHSLPRVLGEWLMARDVARWLKRDGFVIMDGSLAVWGGTRRALVREVMDEARRNGTAVCGLSKSSELRMAGGRPLLAYINEKYGGGTDALWYVDIGGSSNYPKPGDYHTMVVKLHPRSAWIYRLDIDAVAYRMMGGEGVEHVLGSLVANSSDMTMLGYPYGLIHADRYAKVRRDETSVFGMRLHGMLGTGPRMAAKLNAQHDYLNRVAGG